MVWVIAGESIMTEFGVSAGWGPISLNGSAINEYTPYRYGSDRIEESDASFSGISIDPKTLLESPTKWKPHVSVSQLDEGWLNQTTIHQPTPEEAWELRDRQTIGGTVAYPCVGPLGSAATIGVTPDLKYMKVGTGLGAGFDFGKKSESTSIIHKPNSPDVTIDIGPRDKIQH